MNAHLHSQLTRLRDNLKGSSIFPVDAGESFYHGGRPLQRLSSGRPLWATITPASANQNAASSPSFTTITRLSAARKLRLLDIGHNTLKAAYEELDMQNLSEYEKLLSSYCDLIRIDGILCRGEKIFFAHQENLEISGKYDSDA